VKPEKFYKELRQTSDAEEALDLVFTGKADAAIVDTCALSDYREDKPGRGKRVKSLQQSEPFPGGVIAYSPGRLKEADVTNFRKGLVAAKTTAKGRAMLEMLKLTAFEVPPSDFDVKLKAIARAYPPPTKAK
jgi:ABC-type phosphate/phosphonate transport system substrate-binding protein